MRREAPEPWASAMTTARATAPNTGRPSITRLAEHAGISVEATRRLLYGMGSPNVQTVEAVARALKLDVRTVSAWADQARSVVEPYEAPAEADLLTTKERRAVTSLIRAITDGRRGNAQAQEPRTSSRGTSVKQPPPMTEQEALEWAAREAAKADARGAARRARNNPATPKPARRPSRRAASDGDGTTTHSKGA